MKNIEWIGTWDWRLMANSRVGFAYQRGNGSAISELCPHRHRSEKTAKACGLRISSVLNQLEEQGR